MTKSSQVDQDLIRAIAELLNKENLAEIEIEQEDFRVRVTRSYANEAPVYAQAPQYLQAPPQAAPASVTPAGSVPAAAPAKPFFLSMGSMAGSLPRKARYAAPGSMELPLE